MIVNVGVEVANSFVKLKTSDSTNSYLNTLRELEPFEIDVLGKNEVIYGLNGKSYIKGEAWGSSSSGRDSSKYFSEQYLNELLVALADLVLSDGQKFRIVTGLPCEDYKNKTIRERLPKHLIGEYGVMVNGSLKRFFIDMVDVVIQPLGSLLYLIYDANGKTKQGKDSLKSMKSLIIDIGYGTTDIVEVKDLKPTRYVGADVGMMTAMNYLEDYIKLEYPDIKGLARGLELNQEIENMNVVNAGGSQYVVTDEIKKAFDRTTKEVMREVNKLGFDIRSYDKVVFTGGGTLALADYLKPYTEGINAVRVGESQLANAIGFYIYGVIKNASKPKVRS